MHGRKEKLKSFYITDKTTNPTVRFVPTDDDEREALYTEFEARGIKLPSYDSFERKALRKRDMMVLVNDWECSFGYDGRLYRCLMRAGSCFDGASVPRAFVKGDLSKHGQAVQEPSLLHDALFALHLMSFEDSNNVFEAFLRTKKIWRFVIALYSFGVRTPIGKRIYNKSVPSKHWLYEFVYFIEEFGGQEVI